jgi:hypothetical protein
MRRQVGKTAPLTCAYGTPWLDHFTAAEAVDGTGRGCAACGMSKGRITMAKKSARPTQGELIADRKIKPLDDVASAYADLRDRRIELTQEEAELKATAIKLMHKYGKTIYRHDGIEILLKEGEEDIKVKVRKDEPDADGDDEAVIVETAAAE